MTSQMHPNTPMQLYAGLIAAGTLKPSPAQAELVARLERLHNELADYTPPSGRKLLGFLRKSEPRPRGLYIWGGVGRGKSMLMDMFFDHAPVAKKRRVHFHSFMIDVHARIHRYRQSQKNNDSRSNPIPPLAKTLASEATLLCLDEFQVQDVADAMILGRLFSALIKEGVVVVITSNRAPDQLYLGGLQRDRFMRFVSLVLEQMDVIELESHTDFRLMQLQALQKVFVSPLGDEAHAFLDSVFAALTHHAKPEQQTLEMQGRTLTITASRGVARASFSELCEKPLGAADYLEIAQEFHTLILENIPAMSPEKRNEAKRFVTLIDALYENHVNLICSAAAAPDKLYPKGDGSFEFGRTASRLIEMQSEQYLATPHGS